MIKFTLQNDLKTLLRFFVLTVIFGANVAIAAKPSTLEACCGHFRPHPQNSDDSVTPSLLPLQMRSYLERTNNNKQQRAQMIIGNPLNYNAGNAGSTAGYRLKFSVLVPNDWTVTSADLVAIHTLQPDIENTPNYYQIYIMGDQWYFDSASMSYAAPIAFGQEQLFEVRVYVDRTTGVGWVEAFIDQEPTGSGNPLPGQFVPRHTIYLNPADKTPYLLLGLDTLADGMANGVQSRELHWTFIRTLY